MNILPFLPIVVGVALVCAPISNKNSAEGTTPSLDRTATGNDPSAAEEHPHHPMGSKIGGAKGNIVFNWFTVPHNPDEVKANTKPNYSWSRGFNLKTEVAMKCGDVQVKPGTYRVAFKLDGEAKNWSVVLSPARQRGGRGRGQRGAGRGQGGGQGRGQGGGQGRGQGRRQGRGQGGPSIEIPMTTFAGKHAEHMAVVAINHGYKTVSRRDPSPAGGTKGEFRISFGDIHTAWSFEEVFEEKEEKKDGETVEEIKKK